MDNISPNTAMALLNVQQSGSVGDAGRAIESARKSRDLEKIESSAEDFEAMFVSEMMKPMFEGLATDGPFGGGKGEEVFRGMMLQEYGKLMAQTGTIGLTDTVREQMILMQEQAQAMNAIEPGS